MQWMLTSNEHTPTLINVNGGRIETMQNPMASDEATMFQVRFRGPVTGMVDGHELRSEQGLYEGNFESCRDYINTLASQLEAVRLPPEPGQPDAVSQPQSLSDWTPAGIQPTPREVVHAMLMSGRIIKAWVNPDGDWMYGSVPELNTIMYWQPITEQTSTP